MRAPKVIDPSISSIAECRAWGDPHITTFDGANNDVYGVGKYVFAQTVKNLEDGKTQEIDWNLMTIKILDY